MRLTYMTHGVLYECISLQVRPYHTYLLGSHGSGGSQSVRSHGTASVKVICETCMRKT